MTSRRKIKRLWMVMDGGPHHGKRWLVPTNEPYPPIYIVTILTGPCTQALHEYRATSMMRECGINEKPARVYQYAGAIREEPVPAIKAYLGASTPVRSD